MIILGYGLALLIGFSLGLLGGGGSILTVPVLHFVMGYGVKETVPMSLIVVGLTSAVGAALHARRGTVHWRAALSFGPPAIVGAVLGAELGLRVDPGVQLAVLGGVMLVAAISMLRRRGDRRVEPGAPARSGRPLAFVTLIGALVGLLTGFVGIGGGFLYVPALTLLGRLPLKEAIGTSLVLILASCAAATARYHGAIAFDWPAILLFSGIATVGVAVGSRISQRAPQTALRKGFAVLILLMGAVVLVSELHARSAP
jgi:uncharacterized protein